MNGIKSCVGVIVNNLITGNQHDGIELCDGPLLNNTIIFNHKFGLDDCDGTITNNIIWGNNGGAEQLVDSFQNPNYCCIQNYTGGGTGNVAAAPLFMGGTSTGGAEFRLSQYSPCIDAGAFISSVTEDYVTEDLWGDLRPFDGTSESRGDGSDYDIGAFEFSGPLFSVSADPLEGAPPLQVVFAGEATASRGFLTAYRWLIDDVEVNSQVLIVTSSTASSSIDHTFHNPGRHETYFEVEDDLNRWYRASRPIQVWTLTPTPIATFTPTPMLTPTPPPTETPLPTRTPIASDINRDGYVDERDLFLMHQEWHQGQPPE